MSLPLKRFTEMLPYLGKTKYDLVKRFGNPTSSSDDGYGYKSEHDRFYRTFGLDKTGGVITLLFIDQAGGQLGWQNPDQLGRMTLREVFEYFAIRDLSARERCTWMANSREFVTCFKHKGQWISVSANSKSAFQVTGPKKFNVDLNRYETSTRYVPVNFEQVYVQQVTVGYEAIEDMPELDSMNRTWLRLSDRK